jgi:DNA-binding NtrC family response regulator
MEQQHHILIVSGDYVFTELMATMLNQFLKDADITQLHSFNSIREANQLEACDLLLLGDLVEGARGSEVLEYLRVKRQFIFPIAYFCDDVPELKEKAMRRGSNFCYTKPFKPDKIVLDLLQQTASTQTPD